MSDYIKRTLVKAQFTGTFNDEYPVSLCKTLIDEVPSADVEEVRHGKWEGGYCSVCNEHCTYYLTGDAWVDVDENANYCPNCGAKMDLEV